MHKQIGIVKTAGTLEKKDMKLNAETPVIDVNPETYEVKVNGELIRCEPLSQLPMAQRYFLF